MNAAEKLAIIREKQISLFHEEMALREEIKRVVDEEFGSLCESRASLAYAQHGKVLGYSAITIYLTEETILAQQEEIVQKLKNIEQKTGITTIAKP